MPSPQLTQESIVDAAQGLCRRVGVEGFTMRALAESLGVSPMATYHHVEGREQVLLHVVERIMSAVEIPAFGSEVSWDARLWSYMQSMREAFADFPGLSDVLLTNGMTAGAKRYMESCIAILENGGFTSADARSAFAVIYTFMWGGSIFLAAQNRRKAAGKRKQRTGRIPTIDELASPEATEIGYRTIVAGLERTHLRCPDR